MKSKTLAAVCCVCLIAGLAPAATKAFYVTDELGTDQHLVRMKDLAPAPTGLYVQKCISGAAGVDDLVAPTNWGWATSGNAFTNYLPPDVQEYQVGTCRMGDDDAGVAFINLKAGQVSGTVGSSDATRMGWLRTFSSTAIPLSAYYGDTLGATLGRALNNAVDVYQWSADPVVSIVNPAYIIPFIAPPPTQTVNATIAGTVAVGAGNNELPGSILLVEYRDQASNTWQTLQATVNPDGTFTGEVPGPFPRQLYLRARVKDANTPRPGLPVSAEYPVVVPVPEPLATGAMLLAPVASMLRRAL